MNIDSINLWTALITPFNEDLSVDYDSLKNLIKEQESAGNGLLILGSTGEALNIDLGTKKKIIRFVKDLKPKTPIMAGVGGHDYAQTKEWVKWLEEQDLDAYLLVVPIYAKPGIVGQTRWFKGLMDISTKPVMLYNVPGRGGKELEVEAVKSLKDHKNFWAIKEASGSVEKFKQYLAACDNGKVFCGDDGLFPSFARAGSCGLVSVASNTWPAQTNLYVKQSLAKTLNKEKMWEDAANSLFIASNPIPAKRILAGEKRIKSDILMPPLAIEDLSDDAPLWESNKNVNEWFSAQDNTN